MWNTNMNIKQTQNRLLFNKTHPYYHEQITKYGLSYQICIKHKYVLSIKSNTNHLEFSCARNLGGMRLTIGRLDVDVN